MPKRSKDKKKKRKQKVSVSKEEGGSNLLVGKQGLNAPRPISLPVEASIPHTRRHLPFANNDAFPDLSNVLPNLDATSSHQAEADEREWQFLAVDLMGDNEDDLMTSSNQPSTSGTSAVVAEEAVDPGRMTAPTEIQRALFAACADLQQEDVRIWYHIRYKNTLYCRITTVLKQHTVNGGFFTG